MNLALASKAFLLAVAAAAQAPAQVEYDLTLVDSLTPSGVGETYIYDINDSNIAVGTTTGNTAIGVSYVGFTWSPSGGSVAAPLSWPHGVNNSRLAVGVGTVLDLGSGQGWNLPLLPGTYIVPYPGDINDAGVAVGHVQTCNCSNSSGMLQIPYVWDALNGARTVNVPGATGLRRINAHDVAIGWIGGHTESDAFFVNLATGQHTLLSDVVPNTGPGSIRAFDINDDGAIVGSRAGSGTVYFYGFVYTPSAGAQILPLPHAPYQQAFSPTTINNLGQIAGQIYILGSPRACVCDDQRGFRDLNDPGVVAGIPPGFTLMYTSRINDNGWIVGYGNGGAGGYYKSFVLRPRGASCPGDTNADNVVNFADLNTVLSQFGQSAAHGSLSGDVNDDGSVTFVDLNIVLGNFGVTC